MRALAQHALERGGRAESTLLGTNKKVPAAAAALINGTMVRDLDANDIFVGSRGGPSGHFSDATVGLIALAERYRRSAQELLTCLVASYEIQGALAASANFWERGLHAVTNVAWCTPIVAARLIGATPVQAIHACGLSRSERFCAEHLDQAGKDRSHDQECRGRLGLGARVGGSRVGGLGNHRHRGMRWRKFLLVWARVQPPHSTRPPSQDWAGTGA